MSERRGEARHRTFRGGKILFNHRRSVVDCTVRNLSAEGAALQVESLLGLPQSFDLMIEGEDATRSCKVIWTAEKRMGVSFGHTQAVQSELETQDQRSSTAMLELRRNSAERPDLVRIELLSLRAALDEVPFGVVLLDTELRAQFINRAFRAMWHLPDAKADAKPAFVALMYHGRDTRAYQISPAGLDAYVAERVAHVKAGNPAPLDLRLANGEVIRFQCTVLPAGGRMLSYTYVTDIVRAADDLEALRTALENVNHGVILLDAELRVRFMNARMRQIWQLSSEEASVAPSFPELIRGSQARGIYAIAPEQADSFIAERIALVRSGDPAQVDLALGDGRVVRSQCTILPGGGRMLTYADVTDLVLLTTRLEQLATTDGLTGLYNRRHFLTLAEPEWQRFQRYHRPLSLLLVDIDRFKAINDRWGHQVGDQALVHVANVCKETRRSSDFVARIGGEEFVLLLPETESAQAHVVAERLRQLVEIQPFVCDGHRISLSVSVGAAEATLSMSGIGALMKLADQALYEAKAAGRNRVVVAETTSRQDHLRLAAE